MNHSVSKSLQLIIHDFFSHYNCVKVRKFLLFSGEGRCLAVRAASSYREARKTAAAVPAAVAMRAPARVYLVLVTPTEPK